MCTCSNQITKKYANSENTRELLPDGGRHLKGQRGLLKMSFEKFRKLTSIGICWKGKYQRTVFQKGEIPPAGYEINSNKSTKLEDVVVQVHATCEHHVNQRGTCQLYAFHDSKIHTRRYIQKLADVPFRNLKWEHAPLSPSAPWTIKPISGTRGVAGVALYVRKGSNVKATLKQA